MSSRRWINAIWAVIFEELDRLEHEMHERLRAITMAVRFPVFWTGFTAWPFATHGGTILTVSHAGKVAVVFPRHILGDFQAAQLRISREVHNIGTTEFASLSYSTIFEGNREGSFGSDIEDIVVGIPGNDITADQVLGVYPLSEFADESSLEGDRLTAFGFLKRNSEISEKEIKAAYTFIAAVDAGQSPNDPVMRKAQGLIGTADVGSMTGMSGSPVFNERTGKLCGMILRGAVDTQQNATFRYIESYDLKRLVLASLHRADAVEYEKDVSVEDRIPIFHFLEGNDAARDLSELSNSVTCR